VVQPRADDTKAATPSAVAGAGSGPPSHPPGTVRTCVVGVSEMAVSTRPDEVLVTYSLGSCVGLALYDPELGIGGLVHCMLPTSNLDALKAQDTPCMFADTGVQALLKAVFDLGARRKQLVAKVAGAATHCDPAGRFRIGERNHAVVRKILWKNDILIAAEDVGGDLPRTLTLYMDTGKVVVRRRGMLLDL